MKKRLPFVVVGVLVLGLLVAAVRGLVLRHGNGDPNHVLASGTIEATEVKIAFRMAGILATRAVDEGDQVTAGAVLATLDSREQQARIREAEAALAVAQASQRDLEQGYLPEEVAQARAAVEEATAQVTNLRQQAQRSQELFPNGGVSQERLDADRAAADAAAARLAAAQQRLKQLRGGYRSEQIDSARARTAQAEAVLAALQVQLEDMSAHSPIDGVVTRKHAEPGETLGAGSPVVTVAELARPKVRVYIPEGEIGRIKLGAAASASVDSFPGRTFPGKVSFISPQAEFTPKNVQTYEERVKQVFAVDVQMQNPEGLLKPGMPADVTIEAPAGG